MLAFARKARHVAVPFPQGSDCSDQAEHTLFPVRVKDRLLRLGFGVDRTEPVHAAQIMRAVHDVDPTSCGALARSVPIMEFRPTSAASCSSLQPSVPAGRSGSTR